MNDRQLHSFSVAGDAGDSLVTIVATDGYVVANSSADHRQVAVLRDGDRVPRIRGHSGQGGAAEFVAPYISDSGGTMKPDSNQVTFLFELETTDMHSPAFDM